MCDCLQRACAVMSQLLHKQAMRAWMPSDARTTRPEAISCGTTRRTVSTPIAKPKPAEVPELVKIACRQHRFSGVLLASGWPHQCES